MYCVVTGALRLVSLPFHRATSWVTITPLTVSTVFGLQIGELLLLVAQLDVERLLVDLRNDRLQRHAAFNSRRADHRGHDAARIDERPCGLGIAVSSKKRDGWPVLEPA